MRHAPSVEITALDKPQKVKMAARSGSGAEASGLVNTLQGHVDDIRTLIQCGICIRPLYEPFTIACGHTFCYSCLSSWFAGGRSKRTCPDCRAPVKTQPAPAYLVRAVVQMFTGRAELLDKGETTIEHSKNQREEAERLDQDKANSHPTQGGLFGGLFKPRDPRKTPVIDTEDGVARCPLCSWELEGDNCAGCGYRYRPDSEDTDDSGSADFSETDLDSLDDGIDEDGEEDEGEAGGSDHFDDIEDHDGVWGNFALQWYRHPFPARPNWPSGVGPDQVFDRLENLMGNGPAMIRMPPGGPVDHGNYLASGNTNGSEYDDDEEEDEEENEYDESDSFIDAEDDHPPTSSFVETQVHRLGSGDIYESESESDRSTGTVVDDVQGDHNSLPIGLNYRNTTPYFDEEASDEEAEEEVSAESDDREMVDEEEDESESDEDAIQTAPPRRANPQYPRQSPWFQAPSDAPWLSARPPIEIPDSSEEEEEESPPVRPGRSVGARRPIQHGTTTQNVITLDDSDDDQPVGPVRRATQRRRARFSPY